MDAITAEPPSQPKVGPRATSPGPVPFAATLLPLFACAFSILAILAHGAGGDWWSVTRTAAVVAVVSWWVLRGFLLAGLAAGFVTLAATLTGWGVILIEGSSPSGLDVGLTVCATGAFVALLVLWHSGFVRWHLANGHARPAQIAPVVLFAAVAGALWGLQNQDVGPWDTYSPPPTHGSQSGQALRPLS